MRAGIGEQPGLHDDLVLVIFELDRNGARRYHRRIVAVRFLSTKTASLLLSFRVIGGAAGVLYALLIIIALSHDPAENEQLANRLKDRPGIADRLSMLESAGDWEKGEKKFVRVDGDQIVMSGGREKDYPRQGTWTSPEIHLQMPSTEFIPTWNG